MTSSFMKLRRLASLVLCCTALGVSPLASAEPPAAGETAEAAPRTGELNYRSTGQRQPKITQRSDGGQQILLSCLLWRPGQVQRYAVSCPGTKQLDVRVADCCIPGDHWQVKVKSWDFKPNTAVATSPGGDGDFSAPARVFTYSSSRDMNALIECSYLHGVNVFPAESFLLVESSGGACSVTDVGITEEIDRSP